MKFAYATKELKEASYVIFGCADESGSTAQRKGASAGPDAIRRVSQRELAKRDGQEILMQEARKVVSQDICDIGNVLRKDVTSNVKRIRSENKIPILLGGDHSLTFEALKGVEDCVILYFDAHPDFVSTKRNYYGSVLYDICQLEKTDVQHSILVGHRQPEAEELLNLKQSKINVIDVHEIAQTGTTKTCNKIKEIIGTKKVYVSIDLDVIDPAHAPGVDVPCPGGPSSLLFLDILNQISDLNIIGFDIMELSPPHDRDDLTAHLAVRCILELLKRQS